MSKHRFFASVYDDVAVLSPEDAHHARRALRLRKNDEVVIHDGAGFAYRGVVRDDTEDHFYVALSDKTRVETDPPVFCVLYLPWMKGERMEWAVQKAVELGAGQICLFASERCVSEYSDARMERLRRIVREAARQSGAGYVARLLHEGSFVSAIHMTCPLKLIFDETSAYPLKKALKAETSLASAQSARTGEAPDAARSPQIAVMTGPEGGFSPHEIELAARMGWKAVLLGRRILRCETAPAAALAALFYHYA